MAGRAAVAEGAAVAGAAVVDGAAVADGFPSDETSSWLPRDATETRRSGVVLMGTTVEPKTDKFY